MGNITGNLKKTETTQALAFDIFKVWFDGYSKYVKEFDLKKSKEALMDEVLERVLAGEFGTLKEFAESAFKGFYVENRNDASRFIGLKTNNIAINTTFAINEFFNEKLGVYLDRQISNYDESYKAIAKIFADELEKRGDKYLFVDNMTSCTKSKFHYFVLHEFADRGVDISDLDRKKFLVLPERENKQMSQNPEFYLNQYIQIAEVVVKNRAGLKGVYSAYEKTADLKEFWGVVEEALSVAEKRLPEKTKQDKRFLIAKKEVDGFFNVTLKNIYQKRTREGRFGFYCAEIQEIVKKWKKDSLTSEERSTLINFLLRSEDVNKALKVVDKNGKNYPLNYFVCMSIAPDAYTRILTDLVKIGKFDPNTLKFLDETKTLVRKSFFMGYNSFSDLPEELEVVFKPFKCIIQRDGKYLDAGSEEGFARALKLGKEYIERYNLPKSKLCYTALAKEIFTVDRREPVCLPESLKTKYLNEKTI